MSFVDLLLDPISAPGVLSAKLWIKEGSRADPLGQKGAHQLLGSLLSRGCGPFNNIALADLVEGCGAGLRCDTNEDGLLISLKCSDLDAEKLLPILGWMLVDPHLDPDQIALEKDLSIQALQRQKESPFHLAFDGWRKIAFGDGPYGHDPLGISEDLMQLERKELLPLAESLTSRAQALALTGSLHHEIDKRLRTMEPFQSWQGNENNKSQDFFSGGITTWERNSHCNLNVHFETTGQVVLMLGQPTIPHGHKDDLALRLISCYLGVGMSSLLFRKLREDHGVVYDVGVHHPIREGPAPFLLHASTSEDKALLTLKLLLECWNSVISESIPKNDLELVRAKFRGQLAHGSQTTSQKAERLVQLRRLGLDDDYDSKTLQEIELITESDLQEAATRTLTTPLLSLCGPKNTLKALSNYWSNIPAKNYFG